MSPELVISCEHGGNRVPAALRETLRGAERALAGHAGWDAGAAVLARQLGRGLDSAPIVHSVTRLVVDPNRSRENPAVFSTWTRELGAADRERLLAQYWRPHRESVESAVRACGGRETLHLSVHSFTPRWKGVARTVDVGLLYDPQRPRERAFVDAWRAAFSRLQPRLRVRRNRPYLGTSDGLTTALRQRFSAARYLGIELEISQRLVLGNPVRWKKLRSDLLESFRQVLPR